MEVKPGYKQTEAGVIPDEWDTASLETACVTGGLVRGPFGGSLKKEIFVAAGKKVYEQRNAIHRDATAGNYFIDESKYRDLQRFAVLPGEFIVSCAGTIGRIFRIPLDAPPGVINQALLKLRTDDKVVDSDFFYHYFDWEQFQRRIIDNTHGGAMQNLVGMELFRSVQFSLPPLAEQRAIAEALSDVDALLGGLDRLIAKKRELRQAAMQQLLTGQTRLPGSRGDWSRLNMAENSTLKARIGWQGLTTAEYLETGKYYLVTGTDFFDGRIAWLNCFYVEAQRYTQDRNIQLRPNDILLTKDGTIGKVAFVDDLPGPATLNSGVFVIRPKDGAYDPRYFFYVLSSRIFEEFLTRLQAGSTITHLYQKDFVNFSCLAPSTLAEQTAIAEMLNDMDAELGTLAQRREKTRAIKHAMMQELLTGRTRLVSQEAYA